MKITYTAICKNNPIRDHRRVSKKVHRFSISDGWIDRFTSDGDIHGVGLSVELCSSCLVSGIKGLEHLVGNQ